MMRHTKSLIPTVLAFLAVFGRVPTTWAQYTVLYNFAGGTNDGQGPNGSLIESGSTLYGMTNVGGNSNSGTVFSINTTGDTDTILHSFVGGTNDGAFPLGSLLLSGSTIYGMTQAGGINDYGTVFSISTSGGPDSLLHSFAGAPGDGRHPDGSLVLSGSTLYGMTNSGGNSGVGSAFSISTGGGADILLHSFAGGPNDGEDPTGSLILNGSTLYGVTFGGNTNTPGTVFSISTSGGADNILHYFTSEATTDGDFPVGSLVLSGTTLYGVTGNGGSSNEGTVFSIRAKHIFL